MTLVIAHRGASAYEPENTLAAFDRARAMGADGVELDIHVTADGIPVVHHDSVLGADRIADTRLEMLRGTEGPGGEPLPTLAEALEILQNLRVYVEVKAIDPDADAALFAVLDDGPDPSRYQVHAFDHRAIHRMRAARPDYVYGVLRCARPVSPLADLRDTGAQVLWQLESAIDADLVESVHAENAFIIAWTVDSPVRMRELARWGVDAICTNVPDRAKEWLV